MKTNKKLWIVTYNFHPAWAGPAERFLRYYDGLTKRNLDVEYITAYREGLSKEEVYGGAKVKRLATKNNTSPNLKEFIDLASDLALEKDNRPDCFMVLLGDLFNAAKIKNLSKVGITTTFVNTMIYKPSPSKNPIKKVASHLLNKRFFNAFDFVVCSTNVLKEAILKLGISQNKLSVISNGVILDRFKPLESHKEIDQLRQELNLPLKEKIALFVGLRVERKGIIDLIGAWKKYKKEGGQGTLALVGGEQRDNPLFKSFYKDWDTLMETVEEDDKVLILPPSRKIEQYFQACDFFIFLSKKEGMPNVLTEAMAAGCPLITTEFEGFSDTWGKHNKELLIVKRDIQDISRAIKVMAEDQNLYDSIRSNAIAHVKANHNVEQSLDKYKNIVAGKT